MIQKSINGGGYESSDFLFSVDRVGAGAVSVLPFDPGHLSTFSRTLENLASWAPVGRCLCGSLRVGVAVRVGSGDGPFIVQI